MKKRGMIGKSDLLLAGSVILLAAGFGFFHANGRTAGAYAYVIRNGVQMERYALSKDRVVRLTDADGGWNELVIENGGCYIREADCPDGLCIRQGRIERDGESIVCLPHRLVIEIKGGDATAVDAEVR